MNINLLNTQTNTLSFKRLWIQSTTFNWAISMLVWILTVCQCN